MRNSRVLVAVVAALLVLALLLLALPGFAAAAEQKKDRSFDLQAHRDGMGLAVESSLLSFGNALEFGVSALELDVQMELRRQQMPLKL